MARQIFYVGIIGILAVVAVIVIRRDVSVLSDSISITTYSNGGAMVQVHYRRDSGPGQISVELDGHQIAIKSYPARPQLYWNSNFYFQSDALVGKKILVRVTFQDSEHTEVVERRVVPLQATTVLQPIDFDGVATPTQSMTTQWRPRGIDAPDLDARTAQCAPTAAVDSFIALAKQHGEDTRLPASALTMIDELKHEMRWTLRDGVTPENYVTGANVWAKAKGLDVITEKAGSQNGTQTLESLGRSLATGNGAQMRLSFSVPSGGTQRVLGGHLVAVVGIHELDGKTFIDVHDPVSPSGVDTYRVDGTRIVDYVLFPAGSASISWGFTQTWTGGTMELP